MNVKSLRNREWTFEGGENIYKTCWGTGTDVKDITFCFPKIISLMISLIRIQKGFLEIYFLKKK